MCILIVFLTTIEVFLRGRMVIINCEKLYVEDIKYFQKKKIKFAPRSPTFQINIVGELLLFSRLSKLNSGASISICS